MHSWGSAHVRATKYHTWNRAKSGKTSTSGKINGQRPKTYTSLLIEGLDHHHEWRRSDLIDRFLVHNIQGRLVDQTNVYSFLTEAQRSIIRPVQHFTKRDNVSGGTLEDSVIPSRRKLVAVAEEFGPVSLQDERNFGTGREADLER